MEMRHLFPIISGLPSHRLSEMPLFTNKERLIATNLKVAYSSLCAEKTLRQMGRVEFTARALFGLLPERRVFLIRNPYERLLSCYVQKISTRPLQYQDPSFYWEKCQVQLAPYLGVDLNNPKEKIAKQLTAVSFSEFLSAISAFVKANSLFQLDGHLRPQSLLLRRVRRAASGKPWSLVGIEDSYRLNSAVGCELAKMNTTQHGPIEQYFDAYTIALANSLYAMDFANLPYIPLEKVS
jgi:hypothetical protein